MNMLKAIIKSICYDMKYYKVHKIQCDKEYFIFNSRGHCRSLGKIDYAKYKLFKKDCISKNIKLLYSNYPQEWWIS